MDILLTQKLNELVDKYDRFVNGSESDTIITNDGTLPTMRGVIAEIKKTRPVQFIPEFNSIAVAVLDTSLNVSDVIRVKNLGYYQKNGLSGFDKVSYSDLYDLRDIVENPYNVDTETYTQEQSVVECRFLASGLITSSTTFRLKLIATSKDAVKNVIIKEYLCVFASKAANEIQSTLVLENYVELFQRTDLTVQPTIQSLLPVYIQNENVVALTLTTAKIGVVSQLYDYRIDVSGIDTKYVKMKYVKMVRRL